MYPSMGGPKIYYFIRSRGTGQYLDVEGNNRAPGARVIQYGKKPSDNDNQQWYSDPPTGTIRSKINDFCITAEGALVLKPYQPGNPSQLFDWADAVIRCRSQPNKVIDVGAGGSASPAQLNDYNGSPGQQFDFELQTGGMAPSGGYPPVPGAPQKLFQIVSSMHGKVVDIKGENPNPDAEVISWDRKSGNQCKNQLWYTDAYGHIRSALNDFAPLANKEGDTLRMRPITSDPRQLWYVEGQKVMNRAGLCLDIRAASSDSGADIIGWTYKGGPNQHWTINYV